MKKCLIVFTGVALLAASADAATLRLYFSTRGPVGSTAVGGAGTTEDITAPYTPPTEAATDTDPSGIDLGTGDKDLYVWAEMIGGGTGIKWAGIGMDIMTTGGTQIASFNFWNYTNGSYVRWDGTGVGVGSSTLINDVILAAVSNAGVNNDGNNPTNTIGADKQYIENGANPNNTSRNTIIGRVTFTGSAGAAYIGVGQGGIARNTGVEEAVYMGHGDEGDGLTGESKNMFSSVADATFVPEPASLILLGLAGLLLRRR